MLESSFKIVVLRLGIWKVMRRRIVDDSHEMTINVHNENPGQAQPEDHVEDDLQDQPPPYNSVLPTQIELLDRILAYIRRHPRSIVPVAMTLFAIIVNIIASSVATQHPDYNNLDYKLVDIYQAETFFDNFDFASG